MAHPDPKGDAVDEAQRQAEVEVTQGDRQDETDAGSQGDALQDGRPVQPVDAETRDVHRFSYARCRQKATSGNGGRSAVTTTAAVPICYWSDQFSGEMDDSDSDDDAGPQERIIERQVDPVPGEANVRLLETIADVEGVDATDLPRLYPWLDEILKNLFSDPPADEAQTEVTFSYYGYRFTVTQDGRITMRKLGSLPDDVA